MKIASQRTSLSCLVCRGQVGVSQFDDPLVTENNPGLCTLGCLTRCFLFLIATFSLHLYKNYSPVETLKILSLWCLGKESVAPLCALCAPHPNIENEKSSPDLVKSNCRLQTQWRCEFFRMLRPCLEQHAGSAGYVHLSVNTARPKSTVT